MGGKNQTTTQTSTPTGLSQLNDIWGRVQQVASQPYTPYGGEMVAGLSPTQQAGISNINSAYGAAQPYFDTAANYARTGASAIDPNDIQRYMSPYTQNVVDATRANFQESNAIDQQALKGDAISMGALGGNRVGVAQSELARKQKLAQDPVIAGLYSNAYGQALGAAQQDRSAAAQGAYTFGALAPSVQNAMLTGAQAQIGAGGLEQGTEQARLSAAYNQYLQAQAFPYQQASFLAQSGLPAVNAMGGTNTTTQPGPSLLGQIAGLGVTGLGLAGGLGWKPFGASTPATMASGYGGGGWNPNVAGGWDPTFGNVYRASGGRVGSYNRGGRVGDTSSDFIATVNSIRGALRRGGPVMDTERGSDGVYTITPQSRLPRSGVPEGGPYNSGGGNIDPFRVAPAMWGPNNPMTLYPPARRFDNGGAVAPGGAFGGLPGWAPGETPMGWNEGDYDSPNARVSAGFADAMPSPVMDGGIGAVPIPQPRPASPYALPPQITNPDGDGIELPPSALGYAGPPAMGGPAMTQGASPMSPPMQGAPEQGPEGGGFLGLGNLSNEARMGLISAGLGMMASKSPFALSAIGEGGLQGVKTYAQQKDAKRKTEMEAARLARQVDQFAQTHDLSQQRLAEAQRHNSVAEARQQAAIDGSRVPAGYERDPESGVLRPITGGPADPEQVRAVARARQNSEVSIDAHTLTDMADQYLAGDKSVFQNLGRGAQGSANIVALRQRVAERAREANLSPDQIATKMADFAGRTAAMRTLGTRGVNVEYAANTALRAIDLADEAIDKLPRTQFVPLNKLRQLYDSNTSSPAQAAAYAATNTLVNEYARVASGGSSTATEGMRQHAREMLNTAMDQRAFKAVTQMMRREIASAKAAYEDTRKEFLDDKRHAPATGGTAPRAAAPAQGGMPRLEVGLVIGGRRYKGGDPNNEASWEKVQ